MFHTCGNLVFKDLIKNSHLLSQTIFTIVKTIHNPVAMKAIGTKCPTISQTRWVCIADVLLFLLVNNNYLQTLNAGQNPSAFLINNNIEFTYNYNLLVLLKTFSLIVEKKKKSLISLI